MNKRKEDKRAWLHAGLWALIVAGLVIVATRVITLDSRGDGRVSAATTPVATTGDTDEAPSSTSEPLTTAAEPEAETTTTTTTTTTLHPLDAIPATVLPAVDATHVGFSPGSFVLGLSEDELEVDLDRMAASGARWVRFDFDWSRIESEQGAFDWTTTDRLVISARERGLDVLGLLAYTPSWARPEGSPDKAPPIAVDDFATFVEAAVARYGRHIRAWEIWNEPNVASFWYPAPNPEAYGQLLVAASDAVRQVDPAALVITGGLAPALDGSDEISPLAFLLRLYDAAPPSSFDAVAVHPYTYPGFPGQTQVWNTFAALPDLRALMDSQGDDAKRLWLTEFGAPTGTGSRSVSEVDQAAMISAALTEIHSVDGAGPIFIYSHRDIPGGDANDIEDNFGLLRSDGTPKQSWNELLAVVEKQSESY